MFFHDKLKWGLVLRALMFVAVEATFFGIIELKNESVDTGRQSFFLACTFLTFFGGFLPTYLLYKMGPGII